MLQSKLCQRACKANAEREIVLKSLSTLKKIKNTDTQADTDRQNRKTIMKRMLNIDNVLQDLMKKHQAVTRGIVNAGAMRIRAFHSAYQK